MPAPIQYPTSEPYGYLSGMQNDLSGIRGRDHARTERLPKLRSYFNAINERVFDGRLPEPVMEFADLPAGVEAQCRSNWAMRYSEPYKVTFSRANQDDPAKLTRHLAHELSHLAGFAIDGLYERDHHGPVFNDILRHVERGERYAGGKPVAGPTGMVRAGGDYSFHDMRRGRSAAVKRGELVPADSWFVGKPNTDWSPA